MILLIMRYLRFKSLLRIRADKILVVAMWISLVDIPFEYFRCSVPTYVDDGGYVATRNEG
jgi:hypothetical protein